MADQNIQIRLIVKDEMSKQLGDITAAANKLNNAVNTSGSVGHVNRLTGAVEKLRQSFGSRLRSEFSTTLSLLGGGLVGGGIVAGLTAASRSISEFAKTSVQLHYVARGLQTTAPMIHRYSDALKAMGQDDGQAVSNIVNATTKLRELQRYGAASDFGKYLKDQIGGPQLMRELQQAMSGPDAQAGMERGLRLLMERMAGMRVGKGENPLQKQLGMTPFSAQDLLELLTKLTPRLEPNIKLFEDWLVATTNLGTSLDNVKTRLIQAMVPGMEAMATALTAFVKSDEGEAFVKKLEGWSADLAKYLASDQFKTDFKEFSQELKRAAGVLKAAFELADPVLKALGITWGQVIGALIVANLVPGLAAVALSLASISKFKWLLLLSPLLLAASDVLRGPMTPEEGESLKDKYKKEAPDLLRKYLPWLQGSADGTGGNKLTDALIPMRDELGKLTDNLMTGGPEGKADGTAGYGAGLGGSGGDIFNRFNMSGGGSSSGGSSSGSSSSGNNIFLPSGGISLLAGLGGGSSDWRNTPLPAGFFRQRARMERAADARAYRDIPAQEFERRQQLKGSEWLNVPSPPGYGPGGNLPRPGAIEREIQRGTSGITSDPDYEFPREQLFYQREAGFGAGGESAINRGIIGGSAAVTGSATVDIDVGGLVAAQSRSSGLFRPSNMRRAPQMSQTGGGQRDYNTFNLE